MERAARASQVSGSPGVKSGHFVCPGSDGTEGLFEEIFQNFPWTVVGSPRRLLSRGVCPDVSHTYFHS